LYQAAVGAVAIDHPPSARSIGPSRRHHESKSHGAKKRVGLKLSSRKPNHVDQHVGRRLRLRRHLLDLSQDQLARQLGLTAQLIQKYEVGDTRISASRLYDVAVQLAVPITWFFEELEQKSRPTVAARCPSEQTTNWSDLVGKRESRQLQNYISAYPTSAYDEKCWRSRSCCRHKTPTRPRHAQRQTSEAKRPCCNTPSSASTHSHSQWRQASQARFLLSSMTSRLLSLTSVDESIQSKRF
jgi:transcriptional regulator with XRE-family HTH domain